MPWIVNMVRETFFKWDLCHVGGDLRTIFMHVFKFIMYISGSIDKRSIWYTIEYQLLV
jgi:hypothetical protein